ncbi:hypothetical protein C8R43DRAFT_1129834 [Mycena crocata]|nr:hypothetical protein C8R43DRAFT_1129834 [Mycena crocata]
MSIPLFFASVHDTVHDNKHIMPRRPATSPGPSSRNSITRTAALPVDGIQKADPPRRPSPTLHKRHSTSTFTPHETTAAAPPRPPRNPARAASDRKPKKPKRPSTATGTREEARPFFLRFYCSYSVLPILTSAESAKQSNATATGAREDVLPWELLPAPDYDAGATKPVINGSQPQPNHTRQPRSSISSGSILSFQDMALLRRRKSTGTKPARPPTSPSVSLPNGASPRASTSTNNPPKSPSSSPKVLHKIPSASTVRPPLPKASSGPVPTISSMETITPHSHALGQVQAQAQDPKFSTADRTILKELKRNISARAAQFVIKGGPAESGRAASGASFLRLGSKHHAYNRDEVPYPRSYAREVLDLDVWETMACQKICDSLTWHIFPTPPTKVLDIGCGTGTWILNCGMAWRNCHFVGMDVVPLHPDLGASELSTRITWVQANFLEGLPFGTDEFDFVHIKRIALGVPEDKWDPLFEEIARVLKPGGAFELIEEDLFFPGKTLDDDVDSDSDGVPETHRRYTRRDSVTSDGNDVGHDHEDDESVITGSGGSRTSYDGSAPTPNTSLGAIPVTPPRTASPLPMMGALLREEVIEEAAEETGSPSSARIPSLTLSSGSARPAAGSTTSLHGSPKLRGHSTSTIMAPPNQYPSVLSLHSTNATPINGLGSSVKPSFSPFLLRTLPKAPPNPRDHALLEGIYNEMNATRFINLSPLSLLANLVGLHFRDVRTHPPLQLTFPPPVAKIPLEDLTSDSETDSDDARDAIIPSPRRRQSALSQLTSTPSTPRSNTFDGSIPDEHRWVNTNDLLKRESRYITLDDARMSAFSPSNRSSFPALSPLKSASGLPVVEPPVASSVGPGAPGKPARSPEAQNRLPNATLNIDVRSLNMHLALRTAEILACSESMWEWVVSYQAGFHAQRAGGRPRAASLASELGPRTSRLPALPSDPMLDGFKSAVLELTREDFDGLLVKFELDMHDHMEVGSTLRDQFSWACMPIAPSQDRKAFNAACERWEQWRDQQRRKLKSPYERHQTRNSVDSPYFNGQHDGIPRADIMRGRSSLPETSSRHSSSSSTIPPERRLSRSIRVFAAWKP